MTDQNIIEVVVHVMPMPRGEMFVWTKQFREGWFRRIRCEYNSDIKPGGFVRWTPQGCEYQPQNKHEAFAQTMRPSGPYNAVSELSEQGQEQHPAVMHYLALFQYEHLPEALQEASKPFCELAHAVATQNPPWIDLNIETEMCLRKLLEAKDCAVRAHVTGFANATSDVRDTTE